MNLPQILEPQEELLTQIQEIIDQINSIDQPIDQQIKDLSPDDQSIIYLNLAYTLSSLYYVYLKVNGVEPQKHKIIQEIQRIQQTYNKLNNQQTQVEQRKFEVNKEAAKRMIKSGTSNKMEIEQEIQYQQKQKGLQSEQQDFSQRFKVDEEPQKEEVNLDIWKKQDQEKRYVKGQIMPKRGHLNWQKEIEKLMK